MTWRIFRPELHNSNLKCDRMAGLDLRGDLNMADKLGHGLSQVRHPIEAVHPIQTSEKNFHKNREMAQMAQLQKMQGIHAPIRYERGSWPFSS